MTPGDDDEIGINAIGRSKDATAPNAAGSVDGVGAVRSTSETDQIAPTAPAEGLGQTANVDAIAQSLAAGEITPVEAQKQLIDEVVASRLPEGMDPKVIEEVRVEVAALLADDAVLQRLLDPNA